MKQIILFVLFSQILKQMMQFFSNVKAVLICQRPMKLFFIHRRTEVSLSSGWHVLFRMLYSDTLIAKEICGKDDWPMDSIRSWAGYVFKCLPHPPWTRRWHIF